MVEGKKKTGKGAGLAQALRRQLRLPVKALIRTRKTKRRKIQEVQVEEEQEEQEEQERQKVWEKNQEDQGSEREGQTEARREREKGT